MVYPALLPLMHTPRLTVVDWTDVPDDLNGLVRFAERRNLISARVPSHFNWPVRSCTVRRSCRQRSCQFYQRSLHCVYLLPPPPLSQRSSLSIYFLLFQLSTPVCPTILFKLCRTGAFAVCWQMRHGDLPQNLYWCGRILLWVKLHNTIHREVPIPRPTITSWHFYKVH